MQFPDKSAVMVNTGGPDIPAVVEASGYPNNAIGSLKAVRVRFPSGTAAWLEPACVRLMVLADYERVHGQRWCDWQRQLWSTLIFRYGRDFVGLDRAQLESDWRAGWSVGATAKRLATAHNWARRSYTAPAHVRPWVADLGDEPLADSFGKA